MKTKKLFMIFAIAFSVFALTGIALATDTVGINVTSEPIHAKAVSDKGGGFTLTFDEGTILAEGDQITADLTFGVTLAKDIDIEVSAGGSEGLWNAGNIPIGTGGPVVASAGGVVVDGADGGVYFHIYGTAGSQRITIDVLGDGNLTNDNSLTVTDATNDADTLKLSFLDQRTNADFGTDGIYTDTDDPATSGVDEGGDGVYDQDATLGDNTLCINVSQYDGTTVLASFDSKGDKFTFVPSNPEVAHVVSALTIAFDPCKGQEPGNIVMGDRITQGNDTCDFFDNETSHGFCTIRENRMIIGSSAPFDQADYTVKMEILVNGESGDNGVYWTDESVRANGFDTKDDACNATSSDLVSLGSNTYKLANGGTATPDGVHFNECDVDDDARAVVLTTPLTNLDLDPTSDYLWIDIPAFNYDLDEIQEGDVVSVKVTITKVPCGSVFEGTWTIGTFGCQVTAATGKLLFPYFTEMGETDSFWDGIAIVNGSSSDGTATLTVYEADGDVATMTVDVKAHSSYVNLLSAMLSGMTLSTSVDGTLGNAKAYIVVTTDFVPADGFAMMGEQASGVSMGYLPRVNFNADAISAW